MSSMFDTDVVDIKMLFPTPMCDITIQNPARSAIQNEMQNAVNGISWISAPTGWGKTHQFSNNNFNEDEIEKLKLNNFKSVLAYHVEQYAIRILKFAYKPFRTTSWFTKFDKGEYAHMHSHTDADISGCYYFKTSGNDGNIFFRTPVSTAESSHCYGYFAQSYEITPSAGKLLLFPGWLLHGVQTNETDVDRISLSFNIYFNR